MKKIIDKHLLFVTFVVALLVMLPDVFLLFEHQDKRTVLGKIVFLHFQTLIYCVFLMGAWLVSGNKFVIKYGVFVYVLFYSLVKININELIHGFLNENGLYLGFLMRGQPFFLHVIVLVSVLAILYVVGYVVFNKVEIKRVLVFVFVLSFASFAYIVHENLGFNCYLRYIEETKFKMVLVLNNYTDVLCKSSGFQCFELERNEVPLLLLDLKNQKHRDGEDVRKEVIGLYESAREEFLSSLDDVQVFLSEDFKRKKSRAINFGFKKLMNDKILVVFSSEDSSSGLDFYLFYMYGLTLLFVFIWLAGAKWLYSYHKKKIKFLGLNNE